jgi:type IV secretion system protein VirB8
MFKLGELINKFRKEADPETAESLAQVNAPTVESATQKVRNWYEERYDNIAVQRNLLFVLLLVLLCLSIVSIGVVAYVVNSKKFDPFVIQIDDTTGMAKIVNPISSSVLSGNEALARYFIKKYIIARETYNAVDFETIAQRNIRLLSSSQIYWSYRGYLRNDDVNPGVQYGQKNSTYLTVKSWSKLSDDKYILRFSINETAGNRRVFNKIAVVEFKYLPMELTESERDVNPVGFQVTGYRVDDDDS